MNAYINYFVEANLSLCFFLAIYFLLLNSETDFQFKRTFMLVAVTASVTLPLFHLNSHSSVPSLSSLIPATWLPEITVTGNPTNVKVSESHQLNTWSYIYLIYGMGVLLFFILFVTQVVRLLFVIRKSKKHLLGKYLIVESEESKATFSFFRYIFIGQSNQLSEKEKNQVIQHERVHANRYHSIDLLIINLLLVFFWFNPLIRTYRKIFIQLHEFEADARAVENHDVNDYCSLLARVALQSADFRIANHFTNSLTIKRIHMIRTVKTKISNWKIIGVAMMATMFFYFIASQEQVIAQSTPSKAEVSQSNEVYDQVDEMAQYYENGLTGLGSFISQNLRYPEDARKKGLEGGVYVSFVVEKDGTPADVKVVKGIGKSADEEAIRVIKLTKWIPGKHQGKIVRSRFVMPINYKLNN